MAALVDTNVLVHRFDPRQPAKQARATEILRAGIEGDSLLLSHQAIVEFVAAVTRPLAGGRPLLTLPEAVRETEELCAQFTVRPRRLSDRPPLTAAAGRASRASTAPPPARAPSRRPAAAARAPR